MPDKERNITAAELFYRIDGKRRPPYGELHDGLKRIQEAAFSRQFANNSAAESAP